MHNPYRGGTADVWYSGPSGDLWVEYKYLKRVPPRGFLPDLTPLQKRWLDGRYAEGRNVAVIIGSPSGCVVLTKGCWHRLVIPSKMKLSRQQVAKWITNNTYKQVLYATKQRRNLQRDRKAAARSINATNVQ